MKNPYLLYVLVLLAYLPGLVTLFKWRKCWHFPLVSFAFLGMFFFNAIGSISVFSDEKLYILNFNTSDVAAELVFVLIFQVFIFYVIALPYLLTRPLVRFVPVAAFKDRSLILIGLAIIILLDTIYFIQTRNFLIFQSVDGIMNMDNALELRNQYVYGLRLWFVYNLGFFFLPLFLSNYALILLLEDRTQVWFVCATFVICLGSYLTLGSKSGFLVFVLSLTLSFLTYYGVRGQELTKFLRFRKFWFFVGISVVLLFIGYSRAMQGAFSPISIFKQIWYRVFVTYPETLAGSLSYLHDFGALGVSALPSIHGLLPHETISLSTELHRYIAGSPGGVSVPFAGEVFLIGGWLAFLFFLPIIFITLIIIQECCLIFPHKLSSISILTLFAYMAMNISMNGIFASLYNLMYPFTLLLLFILNFGLKNISGRP